MLFIGQGTPLLFLPQLYEEPKFELSLKLLMYQKLFHLY